MSQFHNAQESFKLTLSIFILALLLLSSCVTQPVNQQQTEHALISATNQPIFGLTALHSEISSIINDPELQATTIGISSINLNTSQVLFQYNSDKLFHPASTMKLYTTAAALSILGPEYSFQTAIATMPEGISNSTIHGDLWLVGSGDPTLKHTDLMSLASQLKSHGITQITGNLVCDDSAFDDIRYGKGWMWDDQPYKDFAPIGALSVNRNTVTVFVSPSTKPNAPAIVRIEPPTNYVQINNEARSIEDAEEISDEDILSVLRRWQSQENSIDITGKIPLSSPEIQFTRNIVSPAEYTGTLFRDALTQNGITLQGTIIRGAMPSKAQIIAQHESSQLSEIIIGMNKESHNLDAELLLKALGRKFKDDQGTDDYGIEAITEYLTSNGVNFNSTRIADGSGVSRYNLASPANLLSLLQTVYKDFAIRHEFITSLPIAGVDGNLKNRMQESAAAEIVHAKTGAMTGVSCLAGYTQSFDKTPIAFVIMMEHFIGSHQPFRLAQDKIADIFSRYSTH